jgi:hypothetical protein
MSETYTAPEDQENRDAPGLYEIRIQGHLGDRWAASFGGLTFTLEENGVTSIVGPVRDQAALHGLLRKVRDLGMPLISVIRVRSGQTDA